MAEPPASLPLTYPGAVVKQDAEPVKKDAAAGPIASSLSTLTSIPPLSDIGEPGDTQVGLGAWLSSHSGHVTKTGEYQGVSPSPFWVVDGLYSNGFRTLGIYGNQTDNESNQAGLHYFQPGLFADVEYQRFIHRLEHVPLTNFTPSNAITDKTNFPANSTVLGRDRNVGEDYAIRVEELQSSTGWKVNDNLRVRVDFWQMRKFGDRQENAAAHCFVAAKGGSANCHVLSQSQHIDWTTSEVTPRVEARLGIMTLEYSRPMRQFSNNDQVIVRDYNNGVLGVPTNKGGMIWGTYPYADVPATLTQIDRLKLALDLGNTRQFYAFGYIGNTDNRDRDVRRDFNGYDLRFTDWTLPRTSFTLYARRYHQTGDRPESFLADGSETQFLTPAKANAEIRTPIEYDRETGGLKGNWRPDFAASWCRDVIFTAGYEYDYLARQNAIWQTPFLSSPGSPAGSQEVGIYSQDDTLTQTLFVGARKPWASFDAFVRYKVLFVSNPLYGFRELSNVLNTILPQTQHIVEFGGGWYPSESFSITVQQDIEVGQTYHNNSGEAAGNIVNFNEQTYATTVTACYAPTRRVSTIASVSVFANWINQNLFLGDDYVDPDLPPPPASAKMPLATQPAYFAGTSELVNFYVNYRLTDTTRLTLGAQFVHGSNQLSTTANPSFAFPPALSTSEPKGALSFADLGPLSSTRVDTAKFTAGIGWRLRPRTTLSLNYDFFYYHDEFNAANNGTLHFIGTNLLCIW
ncbi:MAG: hypothetical protein U0793_30160 [Gemmataceae bacterium]